MKKVRKAVLLFWLLAVMAAVQGCTGQEEVTETAPDGGEKITIVTTVFPAYDFARNIAGDYAETVMLLKPGMESHSYEPSPADIVRISESDLFVYVGGESDVWVDELLSGSDAQINASRMIDWVEALPERIPEGLRVNEHGAGENRQEELPVKEYGAGENRQEELPGDKPDSHGEEYDEHVWTSPANAILICRKLCEILCTADPARSVFYVENTEEYCLRLKELDQDFKDAVAGGSRREIVFGDRFPFLYFAEEYELTYYAAFPGCSMETEPNAAMIAFLTDKIEANGIPVVFYLEMSNHRVADVIAEAAGTRTALFHSCHNLTRDELEAGEDYLSLMRGNLEALKEALH